MSNDYYSFSTMRETYDDSSDYFRERKFTCGPRHYLHYLHIVVCSFSITASKQMSIIKIEHVNSNEIPLALLP